MEKMPVPITKVTPICVCFASDDNYAPYLKTAIYSLLCNRNLRYCYDILILHSNISEENQKNILELIKEQVAVTIRFIYISEMEPMVEYHFGGSYTIATNYRLFLFSEMFAEYDRIIYLDCDTIVLGDISELFHMDLGGMPLAAVEDIGFRMIQYTKTALYVDGTIPYSADNYRRYVLGMKHPQEYFNAGVILFDLKKCRQMYSLEKVVDTLHSKLLAYNDQDTLNLLFAENVKVLDCTWNYQNNIERYLAVEKEDFKKLFLDVKLSNFQIIHYIGTQKPWKDSVPLDSHYLKYVT